jgi:hypothetical protein
MTPQERFLNANQQLAITNSKVDSDKKADDASTDVLYTLTSTAAVVAAIRCKYCSSRI